MVIRAWVACALLLRMLHLRRIIIHQGEVAEAWHLPKETFQGVTEGEEEGFLLPPIIITAIACTARGWVWAVVVVVDLVEGGEEAITAPTTRVSIEEEVEVGEKGEVEEEVAVTRRARSSMRQKQDY